MSQIIVSLQCRTCQQTDGLRWRYECPDDEHIPLATKDEYAALLFVERSNRTDQKRCPFCGSPALTVSDVVVEGRPFDHDRVCRRRVEQGLTVLTLTIARVGTDLKANMVTTPANISFELLMTIFDGLINWVAAQPEAQFSSGAESSLIYCVSARWDGASHQAEVNWEHNQVHHLTKPEAQNTMRQLQNQFRERALGLQG